MSDFVAKARDAHLAIKQILLNEWDPIGIAELAEAQDEYDAYIADVCRLLSRRAGVHEVFDYLWWIETMHMGLCGDRQRTEKIAERLIGLLLGMAPCASSCADAEHGAML